MKAATFIPGLNPLPLAQGHKNATRRQNSGRSHMPLTCSLGERALGVDYGLRRVGLAVSIGVSPRLLPRVEHKSKPNEAAIGVRKAAIQAMCTTIVVGMPVDMLGKMGEQVAATQRFLGSLKDEAPWARIVTLDERLTTQEAKERLGQYGVSKEAFGGLVDGMAAAILLERYFSNGDDVPGVVVQEGEGSAEYSHIRTAERTSFSDWKKEAMARAQRNESELRRAGQAQKQRIGKRRKA